LKAKLFWRRNNSEPLSESGENVMALSRQPLLTIAIPTLNRVGYLRLNLARLREEMLAGIVPGAIEVLVSDNHSTDGTEALVKEFQDSGLLIRYVRNEKDVGSDANIAQCFNLALGHYVQIMGDDDLYVPGKLGTLLGELEKAEYGVVCLRSYGYEHDYEREYPGAGGGIVAYGDVGDFLAAIGPMVTFISACVINKRIQQDVDANRFCGSNLVQVHLVVNAIVLAKNNLRLTEYILACKRNNSGGYDFSEVFVERLGRILDSYQVAGLLPEDIRRFETTMLTWYHPFYLFRQRLAKQGNLSDTYKRFVTRFGNRLLFRMWVAPILLLPRPLALAWGAATTFVGRVKNGDLRRGVRFVFSRLFASR
jgi:abequosyltransferase